MQRYAPVEKQWVSGLGQGRPQALKTAQSRRKHTHPEIRPDGRGRRGQRPFFPQK